MDFTAVIDYARRLAGGKNGDNAYDDLIVDRLHNRHTVAILVCFCIAISTYQYLGKTNPSQPNKKTQVLHCLFIQR